MFLTGRKQFGRQSVRINSISCVFCVFADRPPGKVGPEECGGLFPRLRYRKNIAEEHCARQLLGILRALDENVLDNVFWLPRVENPAEAPTKVKSDAAPSMRLLQPGAFCAGARRPPSGASFRREGSGRYGFSPHFFIV